MTVIETPQIFLTLPDQSDCATRPATASRRTQKWRARIVKRSPFDASFEWRRSGDARERHTTIDGNRRRSMMMKNARSPIVSGQLRASRDTAHRAPNKPSLLVLVKLSIELHPTATPNCLSKPRAASSQHLSTSDSLRNAHMFT